MKTSKRSTKQEKAALKKERRRLKGYTAYSVKLSCGCCEETLYFKSKATIQEAFNKLGLSIGGGITDDFGKTVEDVDTFYGYTVEEENNRSLPYLFEKIQQLAGKG